MDAGNDPREGLPTDAMRKAAALWDVKAANWKLILEGITRMEKVLRREGYLEVKSKPVRIFRETAARWTCGSKSPRENSSCWGV